MSLRVLRWHPVFCSLSAKYTTMCFCVGKTPSLENKASARREAFPGLKATHTTSPAPPPPPPLATTPHQLRKETTLFGEKVLITTVWSGGKEILHKFVHRPPFLKKFKFYLSLGIRTSLVLTLD